ncbi:MAG TPA: class I SAM-dependent methyltransferase [Thermoanaerobaculia bacterium]|nr:class I SAM-dependent methyltransferase [Thermoanaerobaculia bacterium]
MSPSALFEMDPAGRFSSRADDYARFRPDYPEAAIEAILNLADSPAPTVADVGAGTGISSRMLAARGARVLAVEPNREMRARLGPEVEAVDAEAESLPFADGSIDLVTAFQAFHWFHPERSLGEFHRVLRPGGFLALVWNERDDSDSFTASFGEAVRLASNDHPAENRLSSVAPFLASDLFVETREIVFPHLQALEMEGLIGRMRSTSYLPQEGEAWDRLVESVRAAWERHRDAEGKVALVYRTIVFAGKSG